MVISVKEMRVLETNTVGLGIPLRMLMEAAGKSVADEVVKRVKGGCVVVLMGKGGNGGDGVVAARYLVSRGLHVYIVPAYPLSEVSHPDTLANLEIVRGLESIVVTKPCDTSVLEEADVVVDALLGTGVRGELRSPIRDLVEKANEARARLKVAIDTPSGLNPDTGVVHGVAFRADLTVTMHDVKPGLLKRPDLTGEVVVANIGVPREAWRFVGPGDVLYRIPSKPVDAHKGVGGRVLVIGGSRYYTGAPALAGLAALAVGADLSFLVVPESIRSIVAGYSPELITATVPGDHFKPGDLEFIEKYVREFRPHTIVFGNGLGRDEDTLEFANQFIKWAVEHGLYLVVDADGLKGIVYGETRLGWRAVITPHRGEFKSLTNIDLGKDYLEKIDVLKEASTRLEATILLKAPVDIVVEKDRVRYNKTGNPGMTVGGTGDVLAGITGAVLAKTREPYTSACIAAYINGLAGDYLYHIEKKQPTPTNIIKVLPKMVRETLEVHITVYNRA